MCRINGWSSPLLHYNFIDGFCEGKEWICFHKDAAASVFVCWFFYILVNESYLESTSSLNTLWVAPKQIEESLFNERDLTT